MRTPSPDGGRRARPSGLSLRSPRGVSPSHSPSSSPAPVARGRSPNPPAYSLFRPSPAAPPVTAQQQQTRGRAPGAAGTTTRFSRSTRPGTTSTATRTTTTNAVSRTPSATAPPRQRSASREPPTLPASGTWNAITHTCPHCGTLAPRSHQTTCPKRVVPCEGCGDAVPAPALNAHRGVCPGVMLPCSGCGAQVPRRAMQSHVTVSCLAHSWRCTECNERFHDSVAYVEHAIPSCVRRVVACQLCSAAVPFAQLAAHLATCATTQLQQRPGKRRFADHARSPHVRRNVTAGGGARRSQSKDSNASTVDANDHTNGGGGNGSFSGALEPWGDEPSGHATATAGASPRTEPETVADKRAPDAVHFGAHRMAPSTAERAASKRLLTLSAASVHRVAQPQSHEATKASARVQQLQRSLTYTPRSADASARSSSAPAGQRQRHQAAPVEKHNNVKPAASLLTDDDDDADNGGAQDLLPVISIDRPTPSASPSASPAQSPLALASYERAQSSPAAAGRRTTTTSPRASRNASAVTRTQSIPASIAAASTTLAASRAAPLPSRAGEPLAVRWAAIVRSPRRPQPEDVIEPATGKRLRDLPKRDQELLIADWRRTQLSGSVRIRQHLERIDACSPRQLPGGPVVRALAFSQPGAAARVAPLSAGASRATSPRAGAVALGRGGGATSGIGGQRRSMTPPA